MLSPPLSIRSDALTDRLGSSYTVPLGPNGASMPRSLASRPCICSRRSRFSASASHSTQICLCRFDSFYWGRSSSPIVNTEHGEEHMSLKDKTVVITGGSRGLGRGLAEAMVAQGAQVTVVARDADALAAVRTELGANPVAADITDE